MSRKEWRGQVIEAAIEPELPIVDAHHHIWENEPYKPFDPYSDDDLFADLTNAGHKIVATVFVDSHTSYRNEGPEALRVVGETEYAERVARDARGRGGRARGACAAIAPRANLLLGTAVGDVLDAHAAVSPRFRGIRHMTAFDEDVPASAATGAGVMMLPEFRQGFAELVRRDLSFDAWLLQPQLHELIDLARHFPDARIILNHLGGPLAIGRFALNIDASFSDWKGAMTEVAGCPNVFVKLGGLNMGFAGVDALARERPFTSAEMAAAQRHYILTAIDLFGPARCMFESNASIDTYAASYAVIWNAFKRMTQDLSKGDREMLFEKTALAAYRIDENDMAER
jgi:predicted TIM-barrel fold metal-dependent hydrolase